MTTENTKTIELYTTDGTETIENVTAAHTDWGEQNTVTVTHPDGSRTSSSKSALPSSLRGSDDWASTTRTGVGVVIQSVQ